MCCIHLEKHLWILKATGLGVTEFMLRFMAWLCLRNDDYKNSQMVIVTGPNHVARKIKTKNCEKTWNYKKIQMGFFNLCFIS
jgi:hypothetical protein